MKQWDEKAALENVHDFSHLTAEQQKKLIARLNDTFPPERFEANRRARLQAYTHMEISKTLLNNAIQHYPATVKSHELTSPYDSLKDCAIVLTAGGEGERLRKSLEHTGVSDNHLHNFTKATFPLPDFFDDFGTLQTNLAVLAQISREHELSLPVIVSTGPKGSTTSRVIPPIVEKFMPAGLPDAISVMQEERLHLTEEEKIVWQITHGQILPVTHPDETGGPIMRLKKPFRNHNSILDWLKEKKCTKVLVLQATALYDIQIILAMASAARNHDCVGVGIVRDRFAEDDPYGTYVEIERDGEKRIHIIEQAIRNETTRKITDPHTNNYLPYNTGFYAFGIELLEKNDLPDYATPPKEILPELTRTPKVGYAATDLLPLAQNPVILAIDPHSFAVIKKANDLPRLTALAHKLGLTQACAEAQNRIKTSI